MAQDELEQLDNGNSLSLGQEMHSSLSSPEKKEWELSSPPTHFTKSGIASNTIFFRCLKLVCVVPPGKSGPNWYIPTIFLSLSSLRYCIFPNGARVAQGTPSRWRVSKWMMLLPNQLGAMPPPRFTMLSSVRLECG